MGLLKLKPHEKAKLKRVVKNDPHGDTKLLQVNPREASVVVPLLRQMGGADVVNPKIGVRQFYDSGKGPSGDAGGGGSASGSGNAGTGGGIGGNGGGNGGGGGNDNRNRDRLGADPSANSPAHYSGGPLASRGGPAMGTTIGGMFNKNPFGLNSPTAKALQRQGLSPEKVQAALNAQKGYVDASKAYADRGFFDRLGDFLKGVIPGMRPSVKPNLAQPNTYANGMFHDQLNPAGVVGGLLGTATGYLGAGTFGDMALGGAYNAVGGGNYSFGGAGVDPQTGQSTGTGWTGGSLASSGSPASPSSSNHSGGNQGSVQMTPFGTQVYGRSNQPAQTPQVQALLKLLTQPGASFGADAPGLPDYSFYRAPYTYPSY